MGKRVLSMMLCAALILSLSACGGGGRTDSANPPANGAAGAQQTAGPAAPPPGELYTPTGAAEPQDIETAGLGQGGGLIDKTPLYLGGDVAVTPEDFDIVSPNSREGLIGFAGSGTVGEITINFTDGYGYGGSLQVSHDVTLGTDTATVSDIYEKLRSQIEAADADFFSGTLEGFIEAYRNRALGNSPMIFADGELSDEELLNAPVSEVDYIQFPLLASSYSIDDGAETTLHFQETHNISALVEKLGVPKYALVFAGDPVNVDMYLWDAGGHWLAAESAGYFVYFSKSISPSLINTVREPRLMMIQDILYEISR